jgi:uncharacterized protein (TIGR02147 family)
MTSSKNTDFRKFLSEELMKRRSRNPLYSLRSFARDLDMASSRLSDVLRGRYGVSEKAAEEIATRLQWTGARRISFLEAVKLDLLTKVLKKRSASTGGFQIDSPHFEVLSLERFAAVSQWQHFAILELTYLQDFKSDAAWIAEKIGISVESAQIAVERLKRLGFLKVSKSGKLKAETDFTDTPTDIPSEAIRSYQRDLLLKAVDALESQKVEEREIRSMMLSFDSRRLSDAKKMIRDFQRRFDAKFGRSKKKDSVYFLGTQLIGMTKGQS